MMGLPSWAPHILFPRIASSFTPTSGGFLTTKSTANFSPICRDIYIYNTTITSLRPAWNFIIRNECEIEQPRLESLIAHPIHLKIISGLRVKMELLRPWGTELFISIASFKVCIKFSHLKRLYSIWTRDQNRKTKLTWNFITYRTGANNSSFTTSALVEISTMVGCTKFPSDSMILPPATIFPPCYKLTSF